MAHRGFAPSRGSDISPATNVPRRHRAAKRTNRRTKRLSRARDPVFTFLRFSNAAAPLPTRFVLAQRNEANLSNARSENNPRGAAASLRTNDHGPPSIPVAKFCLFLSAARLFEKVCKSRRKNRVTFSRMIADRRGIVVEDWKHVGRGGKGEKDCKSWRFQLLAG